MAVTNTVKGPISMSSQGDSYSVSSVYVTWIRVVGMTTAGHAMKMNDLDGDLIARTEADGPNFLDIIPVFRWRNGLVLSSLGSGVVDVYFK